MSSVRKKTDDDPLVDPRVMRAVVETLRKAHAVGLVEEGPDPARLTYPQVKETVARVREAGVAEHAADRFFRADLANHDAIAQELARIEAFIEETPLPGTEWRRLLRIFDRDRLAELLGISGASAARYARGARRTPDAVAARLHFLALLIGDLLGGYNEIGVRRWFERPRTALGGRRPADVLKGAWQPEEPGPSRVRALARALVESPAT